MRVTEAVPRCTRFTTHPRAITGQVNITIYVVKATNEPTEILVVDDFVSSNQQHDDQRQTRA